MYELLMAASKKRAVRDPHFANVVSLLHFEGSNGSTTFTDVKGKIWTAAGNAQISTTSKSGNFAEVPPYPPIMGTANLALDGAGDFISTPDSPDFALGSGPFTVEAIYEFGGGTGPVVSQTTASAGSSSFALHVIPDPSGFKIRAFVFVGGSFYILQGVTGFSLGGASDAHIVLQRNADGTFVMFANGVPSGAQDEGAVGPAPPNNAVINNSSGALYIGRNVWSGDIVSSCCIDEFRFTVGVARYPTIGFTPILTPHLDQ